jgi:hypothetical protein
MSKAAVRFALSVAFLLAMTACSQAETSQSGSSSTLDSGASPSTENTTAVEEPLPEAEGGKPAIPVASLPIGVNEGPPGADGVQCVRVNWLADPIPGGIAAQVTSLEVTSDIYQRADGGCSGPQCDGFVYRGSGGACELPVTVAQSASSDQGTEADVTVSVTAGQVLCSDPGSSACTTFAGAVSGSPATLTLTVPDSPAPSDTESGSGSGESAPPEATSTSPGG